MDDGLPIVWQNFHLILLWLNPCWVLFNTYSMKTKTRGQYKSDVLFTLLNIHAAVLANDLTQWSTPELMTGMLNCFIILARAYGWKC